MLHNYIMRQALWPLLASVGALGLLALLTQSVSTLDLIIDQRQTILVYLEITGLALPQLVALILPLGLVIAALYSLNRLLSDSELIVCSAAGMSKRALASPILKLAIGAMILNLVINLWVQPTSFRHMRERLYEVRGDLAVQLVRPGQFHTPAEGVTIYVREIGRGGQILDVFIEDARNSDRPVTYMAKAGVFKNIAGDPALVMYDGSIQTVEESRALSFLRFDATPFMLTAVVDEPTTFFYKLSDRYLDELFFYDPLSAWDWRHRDQLLAEGHYRLSAPLYNPALVLIALAALLGGEFSRSGYGRRIAIAGATALGVRLVGFAVQSACADDPMLNPLQYAVPISAGLIGAYIALRNPKKKRNRSNRPRSGAPSAVADGLAPNLGRA